MKRIALAQMNIEYGNFHRNVAIADHFIQKAILSNCDLILLPELWSSGFDLHKADEYSLQNLSLLTQLQRYSDQSNISICGSYIEKQDGIFFNTSIFLQPHQPSTAYRKIHLFHRMNEDKYFAPGIDSTPFSSAFGIMGMGICFDLRFPEFFLDLTANGTEIFLLTAHWPLTRINHWDILLQARAIENQAYMIAVNSVGQSGRDIYGGHSTVISPNGDILLRASSDEENLWVVDVDPTIVKTTRKMFVIRQ